MSSTNMRPLLLIIDGNMMFHRAFNAIPSLTVQKTGEEVGAVYGSLSILHKVVVTQKPTHVVACFDRPEPTFRRECYSGYKYNRTRTDDRLGSQIPRIHEALNAYGIRCYDCAGFEADDLCGTFAHQAELLGFDSLVMTEDMDAFQLVTDRTKVLRAKELIDREAVVRKIGVIPEMIPDYKALAGDDGDGIPQVPGIGGKTAVELLNRGSVTWLLEGNRIHDGLLGVKSKRSITSYDKICTEFRQQVLTSLYLATIRRDVPIRFIPVETELQFNRTSLVRILKLIDELEFNSLRSRIVRDWGIMTTEQRKHSGTYQKSMI